MISPDRRLLAAVAGWTAAAVVAVALPALWPAVVAAALAVAGLVLWDAALLRRTPAVEAVRELPERAFAGREAVVRVRLHNPGANAVACDLVDETPADLATEEPVLRDLVAAPAATATLSYAVRPRRRGDRRFGPAMLLVRSPLGLLRRRQSFGDGAVLRVYPDAARYLRPEALDPRRVLEVIGVKPARRRGEGTDFESLRDYLPGDDPRRVDWRATARRGRLVVRQLQHERNHTVVIALDASRLMAGEAEGRPKLDHAVDAALALAYAALTAGDRVGLVIFDRAVVGTLAPRATRRQFGALLELLRPIEPRLVEADYAALLRALAVEQRQHALVVVLTDFVEAGAERFTAPLAALARRHRVLLVALRDRVFAGLDAPDRDPLDLYRRVVLDDLLLEREAALGVLRRCGVQTLDLPAEAITPAVLNRYLAIRYGPDR